MSQVRVQGNASGTGILTLTSPNTNSNYTLTLPAQTGTVLTNASTSGFPAGSVLQVVSGYNSGKFTTTSFSFVELCSAPSITPSSTSSKILVNISSATSKTGGNGNAFFALYRGATSLLLSGQDESFGFWNDYSNCTYNNFGFMYLDSPATTSAVTYKIYGKVGESITAVLGGRGCDADHDCGVVWTLMEIAG